jgi:hypothetical protein
VSRRAGCGPKAGYDSATTGVVRGRWGCLEARLEVGAVRKARQGREGGINAAQMQDKMTSCVTVVCGEPELGKVHEWEELRTSTR